jgi:hypothetical protein
MLHNDLDSATGAGAAMCYNSVRRTEHVMVAQPSGNVKPLHWSDWLSIACSVLVVLSLVGLVAFRILNLWLYPISSPMF